MQKIVLVSVLLTFSVCAYSQEYIDKIVKASCECVDNISPSADAEAYTMELGICIIKSSEPYKKQLMKDYKVNFDKIDEEGGEQLGQIIGTKMVVACPNTVLAMTQRMKASDGGGDAEAMSVSGQITKIEKDFFVTFTVKEEGGKLTKFYWLTFVESATELTEDYSSLSGKSVNITYHTAELFDPKLGEYRTFNVIDKLDK